MTFDPEEELRKLSVAIEASADEADLLDTYILVTKFFRTFHNAEELAELLTYMAITQPRYLKTIIETYERVHQANISLVEAMKLSLLISLLA